jgi:O-antigen polysaccharide polymerase Wzy
VIILYSIFAIILITSYGFVLNRIRKFSIGLTPLMGWMMGVTYFLVIPFTLITLNGGYRSPQSYDYNKWADVDLSNVMYFRPFALVWLSLMLNCVVASFFDLSSRENEEPPSPISRGKLEHVILITMALSLSAWSVMIWLVGGIGEFLVSHWYTRIDDLVEQYGAAFVLFDHVNEANQIVFAAAAALYTSMGLKNRATKWPFTLLIVVFFLIEMVMSGNRIFFAIYLLAFLSSCWVFERKKIIVAMLIASPAIALIFGAWAAVRHDLTDVTESATSYVTDDSVRNRAMTGMMGITEGTDVVLLMHMINDFGGKFDYLYGRTYGRLLTFFLPKSVYPHRPSDFTILAANLYEPGESTSLASTSLGEAYGNFGFIGIFFLPAMTWAAFRLTDRLAKTGKSYSLMSGVLFVMFIWVARGTFAESVILLGGAVLLISIFRLERGLNISREVSWSG